MIRYLLLKKYFKILLFVTCSIFFTYYISAKENITEWAGVAGDKINVRENPNLDSNVILQLSIGDAVGVLKKTPKKITIEGKEGYWVYIDTSRFDTSADDYMNKRITIKGWVFDYYLAYRNKLTKVTNWKYKSYSVCIGDYCPSYEFQSDGKYKLKWRTCADGNCTGESNEKSKCEKLSHGKYISGYCNITGQLYRYLNLIIPGEGEGFLFINENGKLCMPEPGGGAYCK